MAALAAPFVVFSVALPAASSQLNSSVRNTTATTCVNSAADGAPCLLYRGGETAASPHFLIDFWGGWKKGSSAKGDDPKASHDVISNEVSGLGGDAWTH